MIRLSQRLDGNAPNITRTINTLRDHIYNTANACNCNFHTID